MKHSWFLLLSLTALACTPAAKKPRTPPGQNMGGNGEGGSGGGSSGSGGSVGIGGSGGGAGGSGGSAGMGGSGGTGGSAGSGGRDGGTAGSAGGTADGGGADRSGGGGTGGAGGMGGASAGGPAAGFDKLLLDVPCPTPTMAGNCNIESAEARRKSKMITFGGDPAKTYKVKLKICGVIEGRMYTGCQMNAAGEPALVCVNGMPVASNATYPILSLVVAEPMKTYYLNNRWARDDITMIQYTATFEIKGGSAVTIATDGGTNSDTYTARRNMHNYMCPDVPGIMQPFAGQFVYFTVDSVDPPI